MPMPMQCIVKVGKQSRTEKCKEIQICLCVCIANLFSDQNYDAVPMHSSLLLEVCNSRRFFLSLVKISLADFPIETFRHPNFIIRISPHVRPAAQIGASLELPNKKWEEEQKTKFRICKTDDGSSFHVEQITFFGLLLFAFKGPIVGFSPPVQTLKFKAKRNGCFGGLSFIASPKFRKEKAIHFSACSSAFCGLRLFKCPLLV